MANDAILEIAYEVAIGNINRVQLMRAYRPHTAHQIWTHACRLMRDIERRRRWQDARFFEEFS